MRHRVGQQKLTSTMLVLGTLAIGILIGTVLNSKWGEAAAQSSAATDATPLTVPAIKNLGNEFSQLAKNVGESVVAIRVEVPPQERPQMTFRGKGAPPPQGEGEEDGGLGDLFRRFGAPDGGEEEEDAPRGRQNREASGTGFIVDKNGYIITNNHVIENALKITVNLTNDSNEYRARIIGTDFESDLAVIKIDAGHPVKPVMIANSDSVQVGDWAVAIGSPFGLTSSVTAGIVSAIGRGPDQTDGAARQFQNFIQTDAAINPGNSGGPLLNIKGEVIGINTMIETATGGSNGVGFAVPVNMAVRVYNDIIREGRVSRGSIGVNLGTAVYHDRTTPRQHETLLRAFGLNHGALIDKVNEGGPAATAGMKAGDIVLEINGKQVVDNRDLIMRVADLPVGKPALMKVDRGGKTLDLNVNIQNRAELYKDRPEIVGTTSKPMELKESKASGGGVQFGFQPRGATDAEKKQVQSAHGIVVTRVAEDSFAEELGLQADDIIESINRQPVNSGEDVTRIRGTLKPGDPVVLHVYRRGRGAPAKGARPEVPSYYLVGTVPGGR
jgi:serine protease Do